MDTIYLFMVGYRHYLFVFGWPYIPLTVTRLNIYITYLFMAGYKQHLLKHYLFMAGYKQHLLKHYLFMAGYKQHLLKHYLFMAGYKQHLLKHYLFMAGYKQHLLKHYWTYTTCSCSAGHRHHLLLHLWVMHEADTVSQTNDVEPFVVGHFLTTANCVPPPQVFAHASKSHAMQLPTTADTT